MIVIFIIIRIIGVEVNLWAEQDVNSISVKIKQFAHIELTLVKNKHILPKNLPTLPP